MPPITSADVTVTVSAPDRDIGGGGVFKNITLASIAFGNGTLTYPTGGVPLPAIGNFGYKRELKFVGIQEPSANGFVYKYDDAAHTIKIFTQGFKTGPTTVATNENGALVLNSAGAEAAAPRMPKTAIDTVYDTGGLIELPATVAPAAATLKLLLFGE